MATLVLNSSFQPLGAVKETDAVCLLATGDATAVRSDFTRVYRSKHLTIPAPVIIVLGHYVEMTGFKIKPENLTNEALFRRDDYTCQYCGIKQGNLPRGRRLSRDHIMPRSRGGKNTWDNVTTACSKCNHRKGNKTLKEAKMHLRKAPTIPVSWTIRGKSKLNKEQIAYIEEVMKLKKTNV